MSSPPLPPMRVVEAYQQISHPVSHGVFDNHSSSENKNGLNIVEREAPTMMK